MPPCKLMGLCTSKCAVPQVCVTYRIVGLSVKVTCCFNSLCVLTCYLDTLSFENSNLKMKHVEKQRHGSCKISQIYKAVFSKSMVLD